MTDQVEQCLIDTGTDGRIVGGKVSYPNSWPYTVAIHRNGAFICGGIIIAPDWVITAGHCVFGHRGQFYSIIAGMVR